MSLLEGFSIDDELELVYASGRDMDSRDLR
jgi:hypothetical protein